MKETTKAFWSGEGLPPVGCYVGYETASSGLQISVVTGYDIHIGDNDHRVFIQFPNNSRLLHDVFGLGAVMKKLENLQS